MFTRAYIDTLDIINKISYMIVKVKEDCLVSISSFLLVTSSSLTSQAGLDITVIHY